MQHMLIDNTPGSWAGSVAFLLISQTCCVWMVVQSNSGCRVGGLTPDTHTGQGHCCCSRITQPPYACARTPCPLAPLPQFLSAKPVVYLVNLSERDYQRKKNKWLVKLFEWVKAHGGDPIIPFRWVRWLLKHNMVERKVQKFQDYNQRIDFLTVVGIRSVGEVKVLWFGVCCVCLRTPDLIVGWL